MNDLLNMETYEDAWMEVEGEEEEVEQICAENILGASLKRHTHLAPTVPHIPSRIVYAIVKVTLLAKTLGWAGAARMKKSETSERDFFFVDFRKVLHT